jgi:hypothetical protein
MALGNAPRRVVELVRSMKPRWRYTLSDTEQALSIHLRSNDALLSALSDLVTERIRGREASPVPNDPVTCKVTMAMDKELRWLISRLEYVHQSPTEGEQPG